MKKPPAIPRAPAVAAKLEAAREVLHALDQDVGQFVLDAAEGVTGAAKRLADLRTTIAAAQRDVDEFEQAVTLATKLDRQAEAAGAADMRAEQLIVFKKAAAERLDAVSTIMEAIATAATAYRKYALSTNAMVVALPTGTRLQTIALGRNGYAGSFVGDLKQLIGAEAYRLTFIDEHGRGARLPFAEQPELTSTDHTKLPAGIDLLRDAQEAVLRDVEAQMVRLNDEQMARAGGVAA